MFDNQNLYLLLYIKTHTKKEMILRDKLHHILTYENHLDLHIYLKYYIDYAIVTEF